MREGGEGSVALDNPSAHGGAAAAAAAVAAGLEAARRGRTSLTDTRAAALLRATSRVHMASGWFISHVVEVGAEGRVHEDDSSQVPAQGHVGGTVGDAVHQDDLEWERSSQSTAPGTRLPCHVDFT
jgi:hypothetical protein